MNRLQRFLRRRSGILANRKGFAIVLVAALAGLVFLLGASLVVTSQLQSAASQYDQRMRQARDNARAALEMAVGDLQKAVGRDKAVTFLADGLRAAGDARRDFSDPSLPSASGIHQPFWVGALDPDSSAGLRWLVTRPLRAGASEASPTQPLSDSVTLVGAGTATPLNPSTQSSFDVQAPREPLVVSNIPGYSGDITVGHVAYWIGDSGMKVSYNLRDRVADLVGDDYATIDARERLLRMRASHSDMDLEYKNSFGVTFVFDPNDTQRPHPDPDEPPEMSNIELIDAFVNDFQFRENSNPKPSRSPEEYWAYLNKLFLEWQVKPRFHDFTPLSRGLFTNTANGGLKMDFSAKSTLGVSLFDDMFLGYIRLPFANDRFLGLLENGNPVQAKFAIGPAVEGAQPLPAVYPYLTQFNFNGSFYVVPRSDDSTVGDLKFSYNASFEFWNPYTSTLRAQPLQIVIDGLPWVRLRQTPQADPSPETDYLFNLGDLASFTDLLDAQPVFLAPATDANWHPGEVRHFSGPLTGATELPLPLAENFTATTSTNRHVLQTEDEEGASLALGGLSGGSADGIALAFVDPSGEISDGVSPIVHLYLGTDNVAEASPLASFRLVGKSFTLDGEAVSPYQEGVPLFGFSWELGSMSVNEDRKPTFPASGVFHPQNPVTLVDADLSASPLAQSPENLGTPYQSALNSLFGYNPLGSLVEPSHDLVALELPRQEIVSLANLASVFYPDQGGWVPFGTAGADANALLDEGFFSTVHETPTTPFPNPSVRIAQSASLGSIATLRTPESAQYLYQYGAFNVNSTSIQAWAAMLRSAQNREIDAISVVGSALDILNLLPEQGDHAFYNYPQSVGETYYVADSLLDDLLDWLGLSEGVSLLPSYRRGVVTLDKVQVDSLAVAIVARIREHHRIERVPFASLREFLDAGILENAIADMSAETVDSELRINDPATIWPRSPSALQPSTILNAIEPFLSARSDTFLVRAYGDVVNPADPNEVWARAYCEAVAQRVHQKHPTDASVGVMSPTSTGPGEFGRQFRIVAFRWLTPDEI